ncbi:hypothetical protein [Zooshikella ganghwensis]|uniref:hypothetical protein n=1 Tax=Zooshikella ganghwensis TaxID=202772 RepID=UPI0003FB5182|nr:hypothetical protein [Zooshikella ganghwensis]
MVATAYSIIPERIVPKGRLNREIALKQTSEIITEMLQLVQRKANMLFYSAD